MLKTRKSIKKHSSEIWVCDTCGSTEVEIAVWMNPNTRKESSAVVTKDPYCRTCDEDCSIISKEEYLLADVTE